MTSWRAMVAILRLWSGLAQTFMPRSQRATDFSVRCAPW